MFRSKVKPSLNSNKNENSNSEIYFKRNVNDYPDYVHGKDPF